MRERALQWTPARAAQVCGVPQAQIESLARDYGQSMLRGESAAIRLNYGMQRARGGANAVRAVTCLPALIGAWRKPAGGMLLSASGTHGFDDSGHTRPDLRPAGPCRTINMSTIGDDLLRPASAQFGPAIDALLVFNSNPVAIAPDSGKVVQGFAREDLFTVVLEHFQTDTADYADYILPATTQLEHWDVHTTYGHTDVLLNRPAIAPQGQARSNAEIFRNLAQRMGYTEPCFAEGDEALCRTAFDAAQAFHVDKGGVHEIARRRRNHGQRIGRVGTGLFVIGQVVRQAVHAHRDQAGAEKFAASRRRGEAALRKRCSRQGQADKAVL